MPLTLGIDCSLRWLNLGLADGERALAETNADAGRAQSERLPGEVENFLSRRGIALKDLELIAVTAGPGYYTGIRVGVAYAAALAEALTVKVASVSTFRAMAFDLLHPDWFIAPVIRANRKALYGALYHGSSEIFSGFFEPAQFADLLRAHKTPPDKTIIVGAEADSWQEFSALECIRLRREPSIGLNTALAANGTACLEPSEVKAVYMRNPD